MVSSYPTTEMSSGTVKPAAEIARMAPIATSIVATIVMVNVLYFANLIPPVPLALKDADMQWSEIEGAF